MPPLGGITGRADHVQAALQVDAYGDMASRVIWFIDTATEVVTGTVVTLGPHSSRTPWRRLVPLSAG